jgi:hypothetical protein
MNAATYPDADHRAMRIPTIASTLAVPWPCCRVLMAFLRIVRTVLGAALVRFVISGEVADWPTSPSRETSTRIAGNMDRTP